MTTTTTGTPSPQVRNILLAVAALGLVAFVALNQGFSTNTASRPQTAETAASLPDSVTGFEYDQESTPGHIAAGPVTAEYFGNSGQLYPEGHALDQPMIEVPARVTTVDPTVAEFYGFVLPNDSAVTSETVDRDVAQFAGIDLPADYAVRSAQSAPAVVPVPSETVDRAVAQFAGIDLPADYAVRSGQPVAQAAALLPHSVTGFEYDHESTSGHTVGTPVTGYYFGYNPELDAEK